MLKNLLDRFIYGGSKTLRSYEALCLECFRQHLNEASRSIFDHQLQALRLIQRFSRDKLVVFHLAGDEQNLPLFSNTSPELYAARLQINVPVRINCDFVFNMGLISSIEFSRAPKNIIPEQINCADLNIYHDLSNAELPAHSIRNPSDNALLSELSSELDLVGVLPPATDEEISQVLIQLSASTPTDYARLLHETNGFQTNKWQFLGISIRKLVLDTENLVVLAEDDDSAICLREGQVDRQVYLYRSDNEELLSLGTFFVAAFKRAISAPPN